MPKKDWNPNTGPWLVKQRGARTQDAVIAGMAERGVKIKRPWLSRMENGAQFGDELLAAFQDYYGSAPPPFVEPEPQLDAPDLASALIDEDLALQMCRDIAAVVFDDAGEPIGIRHVHVMSTQDDMAGDCNSAT